MSGDTVLLIGDKKECKLKSNYLGAVNIGHMFYWTAIKL